MAIPWMVALKVIPWGDVIEHAPKVLHAARKLLDRQGGQAAEPGSPATGATAAEAAGTLTPLDEMRQALRTAQAQIDRQAQTHRELTQTVTDLAEQNARLVSAVEVLRLRSRLLMAAVLGLLVWLGVLTWMVGHTQ
jgi:hypothetical protein